MKNSNSFSRFSFTPQKHFKYIYPFFSRPICIEFVRIPVQNENDVSDCTTWQFDMIQFQIGTDILTRSKHMSQGTEKQHDRSDPRAQRLLRSDTCRSGLLVWEEASQQNHLTDADYQKDNGFSNGPECNTGVEVLCPAASLGLTEAKVCLRVDDQLQGLMDGHASRFHLEMATK